MVYKRYIIAIFALVFAEPSLAQSISVGSVTSARVCDFYRNTYFKQSGSSSQSAALAANKNALVFGATSSQKYSLEIMTYFTKDCYRNFPDAKFTIESIVSAVRIRKKEAYKLNVNISSAGNYSSYSQMSPYGQDLINSESEGIQVRVDFHVIDSRGRKVAGGISEVKVPLYDNEEVAGFSSVNTFDVKAAYNRAQESIARSIIRSIMPSLDPIKVVSVENDRIVLSHSKPVVSIGDYFTVIDVKSASSYTFQVFSQNQDISLARAVGSGSIPEELVGLEGDLTNPIDAGNSPPDRPKVRL